jgi:hypothetical protein
MFENHLDEHPEPGSGVANIEKTRLSMKKIGRTLLTTLVVLVLFGSGAVSGVLLDRSVQQTSAAAAATSTPPSVDLN